MKKLTPLSLIFTTAVRACIATVMAATIPNPARGEQALSSAEVRVESIGMHLPHSPRTHNMAETQLQLAFALAYEKEDLLEEAIGKAQELGMDGQPLVEYAQTKLAMIREGVIKPVEINRGVPAAPLDFATKLQVRNLVKLLTKVRSYELMGGVVNQLKEVVRRHPDAIEIALSGTVESLKEPRASELD